LPVQSRTFFGQMPRFPWVRRAIDISGVAWRTAEPIGSAFRNARSSRLGGYAVGVALILGITFFYSNTITVNATTVGFTFLLAILGASAICGLGVSCLMSIAATLSFDYFFLPPVHSLDVADPQDWVALSSFLVTAVVGSSLSARAHNRAADAERRRREVERLYKLSQKLLGMASLAELSEAIPRHILDSFDAEGAALFLLERQAVLTAGTDTSELSESRLRAAVSAPDTGEGTAANNRENAWFAPLRLGQKVLGSVGIGGLPVSRETMAALGSLLAVTIERVAAGEQVAGMERARECERFKSVMLDSITHDFRTPLTCIKSSVTALLSDLEFDREQQKDLLSVVDEECDHIDTLLDRASELARLESGAVKLAPRPHSIDELISSTLADCKQVLRVRPVSCELSHANVRVLADLPLARSVLAHLIANAHLYSSPGLPITIRSAKEDDFALLSVVDHGPGMDEAETARIFEKFYRGKDQSVRTHGTGMGLPIARAIVEAHGGSIQVVSRRGRGSIFTISLPIERSAGQTACAS
jgi:two-component system, OmpR family, sensor histidine kinase KdpD